MRANRTTCLPRLLLPALVSACSSAGSHPPDVASTPMATQIGLSSGGSVPLRQTVERVALSTDLQLRPDSVFGLLRGAYLGLGLAPESDRKAMTVVVSSARIRRHLAGVPLQQYLDCGSKDNLPNAETYQIELTLISQVSMLTDSTSRISTRVDAIASNPLHGADNRTQCTTLGALEKRIGDAVRKQAGSGDE